MLICPICNRSNAINNECGCDPNNLPTTPRVVHRYDDKTPGAWDAFLAAMHSGQVFECDEEHYWYWLEVLPPAWMNRTVTLPDGRVIKASFGFVEGEDYITAFWHEGSEQAGTARYFGCRTKEINRR